MYWWAFYISPTQLNLYKGIGAFRFERTSVSPKKFTVSRKLSKFSVSKLKNFLFQNCQNFHFQRVWWNWSVCREISDFDLVCGGSKSLGNRILCLIQWRPTSGPEIFLFGPNSNQSLMNYPYFDHFSSVFDRKWLKMLGKWQSSA
jgi:hypothetical protein